jgi:hypothetical protein
MTTTTRTATTRRRSKVNHRRLAAARAGWVWRPAAHQQTAALVAGEVLRMTADLQLCVGAQLLAWETSGDREAWRLATEVRVGLLGLRGKVAQAGGVEPLVVEAARGSAGEGDGDGGNGVLAMPAR